jgi:hypothetical protein
LQEKNIVGVGNSKQGATPADGLVENRIEIFASVTAFCNSKALALVVQEGSSGGFKNLVGKRGGTGSEVEDALFHAGRIVEAVFAC